MVDDEVNVWWWIRVGEKGVGGEVGDAGKGRKAGRQGDECVLIPNFKTRSGSATTAT